MTRFIDREKAIQLRKKGMSYSQIKTQIKVSKGTLSYWLKNYPLSKKRISELRDNNEIRIEKFRNTMRKKREKRLNKVYKIQKKKIFPLNKQELFIAGLFLYWGEGSKNHVADIRMSNTDPAVIKFFIKWIVECLKVPKETLKAHLHLYKDMNIDKEIKFWCKTLNLSKKQFNKPYIKDTFLKDVKHNKGGFGHGTCNIRMGNARLSEKVLMSIKAITDKYIKMRL